VGPGIDMYVNRRKSERRLCKSFAKIQFGTGSLPRDCTITDMSAGGVKVIAEHLDVLPPEFTIILSTGNPRQCRLAWRIGHEFGAEFVD
jgi:PilZ domain